MIKLIKEINFLRNFFFVIISVLLAVSCKVGTPYQRQQQEIPAAFRNEQVADSSIANLPWWKLFKDPVLLRLIDSALVNNKNLKVALSRIEQSKYLVDISRSDLYPAINYGAGASSTYHTSSEDLSNSVKPGVNISYQVDLWGRIRTLNEAALQEYLATEEAYKALTINIISATANAYITLRDLDNRLQIAEKTAKNFRENLDVMQARFNAGFISEVDLTQSKIQVLQAEAAIEVFTRSRNQVENAISVLIGVPPMKIERGLPLHEQIDLPEVPAGLPSELLSRRPDLLEAERNLEAQTLRIGAAEALKYPSLTISSNMGAELINPAAFFADLSAQLFGPIFNGKKIERGIDIEKARTEQLLQVYQQKFLTALQEVEDAMIAVKTYHREFELRRRQMEMAEKAAHLSWVRYDGGMTSYLEVLALQSSEFNAQLDASNALKQELISIINLYAALGGGWLPEQNIEMSNN